MSDTTLSKQDRERSSQRTALIFSYVTLLVSLSVYGFWRALLPVEFATLLWAQLGLLALLLVVASLRAPLLPMRVFVAMALFVNALTGWLLPLVRTSAWWSARFNVDNASFWQANSGELLLKLAAVLLVAAALLALGFQRRDCFLVKGQLDAPAAPVRWLGMKAPQPWTQFGRHFAILTFFAILAVTLLPNLPGLGMNSVIQSLPLLPAALLFAAGNAIYEEVVFRAAFLAPLVNVVGVAHALAITILFFGLSHLTGGIPGGLLGVLLAAFFAFIGGKAMLETRGMTWPWVCHFAADAAVYIFLAVLATAGAA